MKFSIKHIMLFCAFFFFGALNCIAQDTVVSLTSIYKNDDFKNPLPSLRQFVKDKAKSRKNSFYLSPVYTFANKYQQVWVYWKEGNSLILREPYLMGKDDRAHEIVWSKRFLNLKADVVSTIDDIGGSSFLVTRQWANERIADCKNKGIKFVVYKK